MHRIAASCTLALISLLPVWAQPQNIMTTFIGGGPNNIPAVQSNIAPWGIAFDASGNYYIASGNRVYKVNAAGTLTVVAGTGFPGYSGDGVIGRATSAQLNNPSGVAVDSSGNIYVAEWNNHVIRKIDTSNTITTIAGVQGHCNYNGEGAPATSFYLCNPQGLAVDVSGDLYISDTSNHRVRKLVLSTDTISTYAGTGSAGYNGDNIPATNAKLYYPTGIAMDASGDLFIADQSNFRVREVTSSSGIITTIGGSGLEGNTGDGGAAISAKIGYVYDGIAVNTAGTVVTIGDVTYSRIRQFQVGGNISTIAGSGSKSFCGDGNLATSACINQPEGIAVTAAGVVYFSDYLNDRVRQFTVGGTITTVAGNGSTTFPTLVSGMPPQGVVLNNPTDVLVDPSGNTFIAENTNCMVRELVKSTGVVNIYAGSVATNGVTGACGFSGAGGLATSAALGNLGRIARDSLGNIYIADQSNCVVWEVNASTNEISIFAGSSPTKKCGYSGDGGPATSAELNNPNGVFVDNKDNVYIGDRFNNRVRKITGGTIATIAGNGAAGYLGDGDPATAAELNSPIGVAVDSSGNVYIADYNNCAVREITAATGIINTIAGLGPNSCGYNGDGIATEQELRNPVDVYLDPNGNLFIADDINQRLRWVNPAGLMTTFAGNGTAGFSGDGGLATHAEFNGGRGIAQDGSGDILLVDQSNLRVREVSVFSALNTSTSSLNFGLVTVGTTAGPQTITLSAIGILNFSGISITGPFTESDDCGSRLTNAATCTIYVYYKPTAAGTQTGSINILDDGFFSDTASISLEGTGTAISVTGGPLAFGNEVVKTASAAKKVTVTNKGKSSVAMGTAATNDVDFTISNNTCTGSLAAGANCTISIVFDPQATGVKKGALIINDSDPSSPQVVGLSGTGTSPVTLSPNPIAFPAQPVGIKSISKKITLTNNTGASLKLHSPSAVTVAAPFSIGVSNTTCTPGAVIPAGQTCFIYVYFTPTSTGYPTGTLSVADNATTSPQTVALSGTATGVEFSPATVTLTASVGHSSSQQVTIINVGASTINFSASAITGPNSADWSATPDPPCGGSLAAGAQCSVTVNFIPSIIGSETATYLLYDNSPGSPQKVPLNGTGTQ